MSNYITEDEEFIRARYQIDVMEARQAHGLMLRTSFQNLIRARAVYDAAKKEADAQYLAARKRLFNRLRKELSNHHIDKVALERAERYNHNVEAGDRDYRADFPRTGSTATGNERMDAGSNTG